MATEKIERGPTSERVARNVAELRAARGLTLRDLSVRLEEVGRPILPSGLHKIERGARRVDVDDLVALALALDVTPTRLLMPATATRRQVLLTSKVKGGERTLWEWAVGDTLLPRDPWHAHFDLDRLGRFRAENRPHDPPPGIDFRDMEKHREVLVPVLEAVDAACDAGLSVRDVVAHVQLSETVRSFVEQAQARKASTGG
jgi:transcriptional regulator with XRE-family HTH domain